MRHVFALVLALVALGLGAASTAAAQVQVVEEEQVAEEQVVERGYVRGQGRGIQYGAHLISPFYVNDIQRAGGGERIDPPYGAGLIGRIGWEFPAGFTAELFGGFAVGGFDTRGADTSGLFTRFDLGAGLRYMFFNDTAVVPFVGIGGGLRWFELEWPLSRDETGLSATGFLQAVVGAQIELTPYFGIELGLAAEYSFGGDLFADGLFSLMPFVGVTLYVYDENDG